MSERQALESTLGAHLAAEPLGRLTRLYAGTSVWPSVVLWVNAWYPLPESITWMAVLFWAGSLTLAGIFLAASWRSRARFAESRSCTQAIVHLHFAIAQSSLELSRVWLGLSVLTSVVFWVQALHAGLLPAHTVALADKIWALFLTAAVVNRALERW